MNIEKILVLEDSAVVITDEFGYITFVNEEFCRLFKNSKEHFIKEHITIIIPKNCHDAHNLGFSKFVNTGQSSIMNMDVVLKAIDSENNIFDATHNIVAQKVSDKWKIGATIKKINA